MNRRHRSTLPLCLWVSATLSCSSVSQDPSAPAAATVASVAPPTVPPTPPLPDFSELVTREAIAFQGTDVPPEFLARARSSRVLVLGEVHGIKEHVALALAITRELQRSNLRVVMLEGAHAESWLVDQFVLGKREALPPLAARYMGPLLQGLRELNATLPEGAKVHALNVDINHRDWALPTALDLMTKGRKGPKAVSDFLGSLGDGFRKFERPEDFTSWREASGGAYYAALRKLAEALATEPISEEAAIMKAMTDIAVQSLAVRKVWEAAGEHVAHPMREEIIKKLVEKNLDTVPGQALINVGGYHAQLKHVMGTPKVWLAEYLQQTSPQAKGNTLSVYVSVARQTKGGETRFDLASPPTAGELFALMRAKAGESNAYLPLRDPAFSQHDLPVNYAGNLVRHAPGNQFHALVLLATGTE